MDALILSCGTGGGHNAAAEALRQALESRGDRAVVMDPYSLRSDRTVRLVSGAYVSLAQRAPRLFGAVYALGELYRKLPWRSPVYFINRKAAKAMEDYLAGHHFDVVLMPHLFPAEILTKLKAQGVALPKTVFVATDYTCIPFTEETDCDAYVIPHPGLLEEFESRGIPKEKLHPLGIPVRREFCREISQAEARKALGLEASATYFLVAGGSMGAGVLKRSVRELYGQYGGGDVRLIVICGTNRRLYHSLERRYGHAVTLLRSTEEMDLYLRACDLYLTKPGGLSITEGAVAGVPLAVLHPIPGCESHNAQFFTSRRLALAREELGEPGDPGLWADMTRRQKEEIPRHAAQHICDLAHRLAEPTKEETDLA